MAVLISSSKKEKEFGSNKIITIGSSELNDFYIDEEKFELIVEFDENKNSYTVINNFGDNLTFKGQSFKSIEITNITRFLFKNSDEFINIKVLQQKEAKKTLEDIAKEDFDTEDIKHLYAGNEHAVTNIKLDKVKENLDMRLAAIIREISHKINDLKSKISKNCKSAIFNHFALFWGSFVCAFGVTNYITGLSIKESAEYIHLPSDLKLWFLFTVLVMGIMLILKQGFYGYFYSLTAGNQPKMSKTAQLFLIITAFIMIGGIYSLNLIYYLNYTKSLVFPILISLFFTGITIVLAISSGYLKSSGYELAELLNKYEYREEYEKLIKEYQLWINRYINNLSENKMNFIKEKLFHLRIKETFEVIAGILTAPFLAYGVSNTLALCFPESAGRIRISGIRFSPVFLVLATFLIIFAFALFTKGFITSKKIANSDIIKHDGFSNYLHHCAEIFGLEASIKAKKEMSFAFYAAISIIIIEFTMNFSYFASEFGQDLTDLFLSFTAALVPTALLIAETFLLGSTKFEIYALEQIFVKADK